MLERILNGTNGLQKALDATWMRNDAIAQNIANVDTPGYKRKTVKFEELLNQAMDGSRLKGTTTDKRHIPIGGNSINNVNIMASEDKNGEMRLDGNNVDIDKEMADMAKNTIKYNTLIQKLNGEFKKIKSAINEGRR